MIEEEKKLNGSGIQKWLFRMLCSRPDMVDTTRELSEWMLGGATIEHKKVVCQTMKHAIHAKHRGLNLEPTFLLNDRHTKFGMKGRTGRNYATNPETRESVSGIEVTLNGAPVLTRSVGQKIVALSVTEAEIISMTQASQDILHVMRLLESMGSHVENPMHLKSDNKGAIEICNNWSITGRTKHIEVSYVFL